MVRSSSATDSAGMSVSCQHSKMMTQAARCNHLHSQDHIGRCYTTHWTLPNYCTLQQAALKLDEVFVIKDLSGFQSRLPVHITCVLCVLSWSFCWRHMSCKAVGTFRTQTAHLTACFCAGFFIKFGEKRYLSNTSDLCLVQFIVKFCMCVCMCLVYWCCVCSLPLVTDR